MDRQIHRRKFSKDVRFNNTKAVNFLVLQKKSQGLMNLMPEGLMTCSPQDYFYEFLPFQVISQVPSVFFFVIRLWIYHLNNKKRTH